MSPNRLMRLTLFATLVLSTAIWSACNKVSDAGTSAAADGGKIPVTAKSEEARKEFLQVVPWPRNFSLRTPSSTSTKPSPSTRISLPRNLLAPTHLPLPRNFSSISTRPSPCRIRHPKERSL